MADRTNSLAPAPLNALADIYQRYIGQPFAALAGGGVRGFFGLDQPSYGGDVARQAYRTGQALGNMPGVGVPAGAFKAAAQFAPDAAMFIGALAKTWDKASHAKAVQMEKGGASARDIWKETGNWRAPDGTWRQEISDASAQFRTNFDAAAPSKANDFKGGIEGPLGGMYTHSELYNAYPELLRTDRMTLRKQPDWLPNSSQSGVHSRTFGGKGVTEVRAKTEPAALDMTTHELQHAVQNLEGFPSGGTQSMFGSGEDAFKQYLLLAGEAEARAAAARRKLTPAQRRALFPEESYDVPINQLIIRRD